MLRNRWRIPVVFIMLVVISSTFLGALKYAPESSTDTKNGLDPAGTRESDVSNSPMKKQLQSLGGCFWSEEVLGESNSADWVEELGDYVAYDEDSLQVVIGINRARAGAYTNLAGIAERFGGKVVNTVSANREPIAVVVDVPLNAVHRLGEQVRNSGLARYFEPNMKAKAQFVPNDPKWTEQWGPQKIQADWAWNTTTGNRSVLVAIVDTGIDYSHPDLAANYVTGGYDWANNDGDPRDDNGHGTHCAGIVAAVMNNSVGIAGLAQVSVMAEKVLDSGGSGYYDWVANGIIHATDRGAKIISMSLGGPADLPVLHDAVRYAYDHGVLIVVAAGNDGSSVKEYPGGYDEVIAVAATDQNDTKTSWSNWGDWIEVAAPGLQILSTIPSGYASWSGTSMATPHVSGEAALIWSQFPNATRDWVAWRLKCTADDLGDPGFDVIYGYGRINARKAVEALKDHDLSLLDLKKTRYIQPGDTGVFNATVLNYGLNDEQDVTVQLLINGTLRDSAQIGSLARGTIATVSLSWSFLVENTYNVTMYLVPVPGENVTDNNVLTVMIRVMWVTAFVLFDQTRNQDLSWYSVLVQNLTDRGYVIDTYNCIDYWNNYLPITSELLAKYDILVIPDLESSTSYSQDEILAIHDFVRRGGGLLLDEGAPSPFSEITRFAGITWDWSPYWEYENTSDIVRHEVTDGVETVYIGIGQEYRELFVQPPALALVRDVGIAVAVSEVGDGRVACVTCGNILQSMFGGVTRADNNILANNIFDWLSVAPKREHDLVVRLNMPVRLEPGESAFIKATVVNNGQENESNVEFQLLIDDVVETSVTIPELAKWTNYTVNYEWEVPSALVDHNVTAYALPVRDETFTLNNINTRPITVSYPLFRPVAGDTANYTMHYYDVFGYPGGVSYWNLTYDHYVEPHKIYVILQSGDGGGSPSANWMIVDTMTRIVEVGMWNGLHYPEWIATNITLGSPVDILSGTGIVNGSRTLILDGRAIDCWEVNYTDQTYKYAYYYDKTSGLMISIEADKSRDAVIEKLLLSNTQISIGTEHEHDLGVSLDAPWCLQPNDTTLISMTVYNVGLSNETDITLKILINDGEVAEENLAELASHASHTINYEWTPGDNGLYNITAISSSVPGEDVLLNNAATSMVQVRGASVAVIADGYQLLPLTPILVSMGLNYDIYDFNTKYLFTENLNLLTRYDVVIFWCSGRNISYDEYLTLEGYLSQDGNLLVTGDDAIDTENTLLAKVVRSSTSGFPAWYSGDIMYVTDAGHPIMHGPYGSFKIGYQVSGVYPWCAVAKADTSRRAVMVAKPGYGDFAKIIATRGLPGKVVFWNGNLAYDVLWVNEPKIMLENMIHWFFSYLHDIAITYIGFSKNVFQGNTTNMNVMLENRGDYNESSTLTLYANATEIGEKDVSVDYQRSAAITFSWNTTGVVTGNYTIWAWVDQVPGETDLIDNNYTAGLINVMPLVHDIAVAEVTPSKTIVGQGYSALVNATVKNKGHYPEIFNVTLYVNTTTLATFTGITVNVNQTRTVSFMWNTTDFARGNYTLSAVADAVQNETNTDDNTLIGGTVSVCAPCDITGAEGVPDGICNMRDIGYFCSKFATTPSSEDWDPNADVTGPTPGVPDGTVNMRDIGEACNHFGKT